MKIISIFNNKGGVGKTTLTFHLGHALAELGHKVLMIDLDPQCNLTILAMDEERIHEIWEAEDDFISDYRAKKDASTHADWAKLISESRSIHFLLKPAEDGADEMEGLPPPIQLADNLDLIPGRLSVHQYEETIARRWSDVYLGNPLAIRTVTRPRELAVAYARARGYEYVIMDTSPSLGILNKIIISTADGFLVPCMPDMFSLYGIRNIGNALATWQKEFETIYHLVSSEKRRSFPTNFVKLLGFTIFNAKKYSGGRPWDLATAHYNYALQIPVAIKQFVPEGVRNNLADDVMKEPIGGTAIMHTHNTLPAMAQKYHSPIWKVPSQNLEGTDASAVTGNRAAYSEKKALYHKFAGELLKRLKTIA